MPHPGHFSPGKETRYLSYRRLGGPHGQSGQVRKILPPPGFDPWTVLPVASRCTDYAILAHNLREHRLCKVDYKPVFLTCLHIQNLIMSEGLKYGDACKRAVPWFYIVSILYCLC